MTYQSPAQSSEARYEGVVRAYATDDLMYGADIQIAFSLIIAGVAQAAPNPELVGDPNFQSFMDHVASWEGFILPSGTDYTRIEATTLSGGKTYSMTEEVTITE